MKKFHIILLILLFFGCNFNKEYSYPEIDMETEVVESFGTSYENKFSNFETKNDSTILNWYMIQDSIAESYFKIESFEDYLKKLEGLAEGAQSCGRRCPGPLDFEASQRSAGV